MYHSKTKKPVIHEDMTGRIEALVMLLFHNLDADVAVPDVVAMIL